MIETVKSNKECIGCGACEQHCPQIFRIVHRPYSEVITGNFDRHQKDLLNAYYSCPVQAIEVEGEGLELEEVWFPGTIIEKTMLADSVMEIKIKTPACDFKPGQYITLRMKDFLGEFNRAYSVVDVIDGVATLCVTLMDFGRAGNVFSHCNVPCELDVTTPRGDFGLQPTDNPKVFVATGTGLVPLISMIESIPGVPKKLYFGQRKSTDLFYLERLAEVPNLDVTVCLDFAEDEWTGLRGRVTDFLAEDELDPKSEVYACGSDGMMAGVAQVLSQKGHSLDRYYYESFTGLSAGPQERGLNWRQWVRNTHFYASLLLSMLFLFFGLSGFVASRPEIFPSQTLKALPANVELEKGELTGYFKAQVPDGATAKEFSNEDGVISLTYNGTAGEEYLIEAFAEDRSYTLTSSYPLPTDLSLDSPETVGEVLGEQLSGKLDRENIDSDDDMISLSYESVWAQSTVEVDKTTKRYQVSVTRSPWSVAVVNLHRGKKAGFGQRILIDLTGLTMVIVTITGMIFGLQSKNPGTRRAAQVMIGVSCVLMIVALLFR